MPDITGTTTNTLAKMPFHFIPKKDSYLSSQIDFIRKEIAEVNIVAARNEALKKFKAQTEKNLPKENLDNPQVAAFLNPQDPVHKSNGFEALQKEYKKLQEPRGERSITDYVQSVEEITQNINNTFAEFLKKEKEAFHKNYAEACPDEGKRKALWEMYAQNLQRNIQKPLAQFTKDIDNLVPQALIHYVNRLGKKGTSEDTSFADIPTSKDKEKLERKLHYKDSNGKPLSITYDKKTGKPSEIRINPMSSIFGRSGNIGDAYAVMAAYHGKDVPIKIVVPTFEDGNIYAEAKDFIALLIFMIFSELFKYMEKNTYRNEAIRGALDKGISLDNISLVDTQGRPIPFSAKDKMKVNEKLQELERKHIAGLNLQPQPLKKDDKEDDSESKSQQPSPTIPTPA